MVPITGGKFQLGLDQGDDIQRPAYQVEVSPFCIDRYEVARGQYGAYERERLSGVVRVACRPNLGINCRDPESLLDTYYRESGIGWFERFTGFSWFGRRPSIVTAEQKKNHNRLTRAEMPVTGVNWYEADSFCKWHDKRLPTEAEWVRAAKGVRGDAVMDNLKELKFREEADCSRPGSALLWGGSEMCDLEGNVYEWVANWYKFYYMEVSVNPEGPSTGDYKLLRGGFLFGYTFHLTRALRTFEDPDDHFPPASFRCATSPKLHIGVKS